MTYALAGLVLGLAGSVHCAGMCGPLVIAVTDGPADSRTAAVRRMGAYHAARIAMYVAMAVPAGIAGEALSSGAWGRTAGIAAGLLLVVTAFGLTRNTATRRASAAWSAGVGRAAARAMAFARRRPQTGAIVLGAVNGLLPCGLVYAALVASGASGTLGSAMLFMAAFGIGTAPVLLAVTLTAASMPASVRARLRFTVPALTAVAGILLIVRALLPIHSPHAPHGDVASQPPAIHGQRR